MYSDLFKILEKYGIYVSSLRANADSTQINNFASYLNVELTIKTNRDNLDDILHKLSIIDKYGSYDEYPAHIQEAIDSYLLIEKLREE